jgi:hypothetical protein
MNFLILTIFFSSSNLTLGLNSSYEPFIGYEFGSFIPYISLSFSHISGTYTDYYYQYNGYIDVIIEDSDTINWNIGLLNTSLGLKYIFNYNNTSPFLNVSVGMPIPLFINLEASDESLQEQFDSLIAGMYEDPELTFNICAGVGLQTSLTKNFSIAGELDYSIMLGGLTIKDKREETDTLYFEEEKSHMKYRYGKMSGAIWLIWNF